MKRVFYFNITYGCNSKCLFCYSHNTRHNSETFNEMSLEQFEGYLIDNKITKNDRVIVNGGEPFLHTQIIDILKFLRKIRCETLIYTNGRLLREFDLSFMDRQFRVIVPIHGYEDVHDKVTGIRGSYKETISGLKHLKDSTNCLVDVKLIVNNWLVENDINGTMTKDAFKNEIEFNNAIHLTKMADTIVSKKNGCKSVDNDTASKYMKIFYDFFSQRDSIVKIFDSCIKTMSWLREYIMEDKLEQFQVFFKDKNQYREMELMHIPSECEKYCEFSDKCLSAVDEYRTLEIRDNRVYINLE